jgi:AraC-like DNA-binding protein
LEKRDTDAKPRGVLNLQAGTRWFDVSMQPPTTELAELIEHYWTVRWALPDGASHTQHTLPHPSVHLVVERDRSTIVGVTTGRFTRVLTGGGRAFGIKFRPAGFRPFLGSPVSELTDRKVAVSRVFGHDGDALVERILSLEDEAGMVAAADAFIGDRLPPPDPEVPEINRLIAEIMTDRRLTRVEQLADRTDLTKRMLQRRLRDYVGVTPKWVIQRYRLHEAAERLVEGADLDLALLARDLGYFDQAHFVNDFRAIVGTTPARYARSAALTD